MYVEYKSNYKIKRRNRNYRSVAMLSVGTVSPRITRQINLLVILRSSTRTVPTGVLLHYNNS